MLRGPGPAGPEPQRRRHLVAHLAPLDHVQCSSWRHLVQVCIAWQGQGDEIGERWCTSRGKGTRCNSFLVDGGVRAGQDARAEPMANEPQNLRAEAVAGSWVPQVKFICFLFFQIGNKEQGNPLNLTTRIYLSEIMP